MIISTLPLKSGSIHYTSNHDNMTPAQIWSAWETGEICVFHMLEWQTRHGGYFTENGNFIRLDGENA